MAKSRKLLPGNQEARPTDEPELGRESPPRVGVDGHEEGSTLKPSYTERKGYPDPVQVGFEPTTGNKTVARLCGDCGSPLVSPYLSAVPALMRAVRTSCEDEEWKDAEQSALRLRLTLLAGASCSHAVKQFADVGAMLSAALVRQDCRMAKRSWRRACKSLEHALGTTIDLCCAIGSLFDTKHQDLEVSVFSHLVYDKYWAGESARDSFVKLIEAIREDDRAELAAVLNAQPNPQRARHIAQIGPGLISIASGFVRFPALRHVDRMLKEARLLVPLEEDQ